MISDSFSISFVIEKESILITSGLDVSISPIILKEKKKAFFL